MDSKVNGLVDRIKEERIEEFYFKVSVPDGYKLKLVKEDSIVGNVYVTSKEAEELLKKLHIRTDSIIHKVFKFDLGKEILVDKLLSNIHELGMIRKEITSSNITEEELIASFNLLKVITKDKELALLDIKGMQQEELYNILHRKHLEYYSKFKDMVLTEVLS